MKVLPLTRLTDDLSLKDQMIYIGPDLDEAEKNLKYYPSLRPWENVQMWHQENGFAEFEVWTRTPGQYDKHVNKRRIRILKD